MNGSIFDNVLSAIYGGFPVLFVGSGFSTLAKNSHGTNLKTGGQFARLLHEELSLTKEYPLDTVSREYVDQRGQHGLFELICSEFSVAEVADSQVDLCRFPWKRIYTTNYDKVIEQCYAEIDSSISSINATTTTSRDLNKNKASVIHLNGCLDGLGFADFDRSIRLTRASYLTTDFIESAWFSLFGLDLTVSTAIIVVGFSTYDIDIARIMYQDPLFERAFKAKVD